MIYAKAIILIIAAVIATIFPFALLIRLKKKTKKKVLYSFIVGLVTFTLFAVVLEGSLNNFVLTGNKIGVFITTTPILYGIYGGLMAGIFEECGRFIAFKTLLFKKKNVETGLAYGIGHAGAEILIVLVVNYMLYALTTLNLVSFGSATDTAIIGMVESIEIPAIVIALIERVSATMLHIGLSMFVFTAANRKGCMVLLPVAIAIHALVDFPAALCQAGMISVAVVEGIVFAAGAIILFLGMRIYRNYDWA